MPWDESQYIIDETLKLTAGSKPTGIPPTNLGDNAKVTASNTKVKITCTPPPNTVIDGKKICTVKGVRIIRKQGSAPKDQNDGTLIADIAAGSTFDHEDTGLINDVEYFYAFFPYSQQGVFNINPSNVRQAVPTAISYWAFDQNFSDKNPATTITYPTGFQNSDFAKMMTNVSSGEATAGDWYPFLTETLKNYPYMVNKNAEADYALNPTDYTKKLSDGSSSDCTNYDYDGGCFAWINKIYMREDYSSDGNSREVQFSNGPADGFIPVGFYDQDQNELEGVWIPMCGMSSYTYKVIFDNVKHELIINNLSAQAAKPYIESNGPRAVFFGGPIMNVLRDLQYMLFKSTNFKEVAGNGASGVSDLNMCNIIPAKSIVPGWCGTTNGGKNNNSCFHSTILMNYALGLMDPYYLYQYNAKVSPFYKYDEEASGYLTIDNSYINTQNRYYLSHLKKGPEYWGSVIDVRNSGGSSTTGLCAPIIVNYYLNTTFTYIAERFGVGNDNSNQATIGVYNYPTYPYFSGTISTAAPMLLPNPGYSPFN